MFDFEAAKVQLFPLPRHENQKNLLFPGFFRVFLATHTFYLSVTSALPRSYLGVTSEQV